MHILNCASSFSSGTSFKRTRTIDSTNLSLEAMVVIDSQYGMDISEIFGHAWDSYNQALSKEPLLTKSCTAAIILGAADLSGQTIENQFNTNAESNDNIDIARVARFAFFGFALQAPWNHFYYLLLDGTLPPTPEPFTTTTAAKTLIDQFIQAPLFTVLIFYFLGLLEGKTSADIQSQLERNYKDTMIANWKLWVPATFVNLAFVPPPLRVLFLNCVFFFWSIFLSLKLNKDNNK